VYYVPPFNPPRTGKAGRSILEDPRLPLDYLKYLFGNEVVRVIEFLEGELVRAQRGETSEVLQLLIGRDDSTRYRIVPKEVRKAAPPEVQKMTENHPSGPTLAADNLTDAVRAAFGIGVAAVALANPVNPFVGREARASSQPPEGCPEPIPAPTCGGCSLVSTCSHAEPTESKGEGGWY
jgi:hypothetical protein